MKSPTIKKYIASADFVAMVSKLLIGKQADQYYLLTLDVDDFKYINDLFGYEYGDKLLKQITTTFEKLLQEGEYFTRINADQFVMFVKKSEPDIAILTKNKILTTIENLSPHLPAQYNLIFSAGIYPIKNAKEDFSSMLDKANYARKKGKGIRENTVIIYDESMDDELDWHKKVTLSMEKALKKGEFAMYLHPKIIMKNGIIMGAEALARWLAPDGIIYPDKFIPVLEQNGFIKKLDFFILEEACKFLAHCRKENIPLFPISVNFSKLHIIEGENLANCILDVVSKYDISPHLIEIELTESVLLNDLNALIKVSKKLQENGFKVSLDDFGSQYSSLSYLKDLPVDIIKIDRSFLNGTNNDRSLLIVAKMVELIKSLRLISVMEGVETEEQYNYLNTLGCDIGQGFLFAKPMAKEDYEQYLKANLTEKYPVIVPPSFNKQQDDECKDLPKELQMSNWELYTLSQNIDICIIKGFIGAQPTLQYVNKRFLECFGYTIKEIKEVLNYSFSKLIFNEDFDAFVQDTQSMAKTGKEFGFLLRAIKRDGQMLWISGKASCVYDDHSRPMGLFAFQDITAERAKTDKLKDSLYNKMNDLQVVYDNIPGGIVRCHLDEEFSLIDYNKNFYSLLETTECELQQKYQNKLSKLIAHKAVQSQFTQQLKERADKECLVVGECEILTSGTRKKWVQYRCNVVQGIKGNKELCCAFTDITQDKESSEALRLSEERYKILVDQSDDIMFDWDFESDNMVFSDKFYEVFGRSPISTNITTNEHMYDYLHESDKGIFKMWIHSTYRAKDCTVVEFRIKNTSGRYIWIRSRSTAILNEKGEPIRAVGAFTNIDRQKLVMEDLRKKSQQDSLTKLYNKEEARENIERFLRHMKKSESAAMFIIDIDNFKGVNDNLGHQFGDTVLVDVAQKIKSVFRGSDIVGRMGGDEFIVFAPSIISEDSLKEKAEMIIKLLRNSYYGESRKYNISVSVGLALYPAHAKNYKELYRNADIALYMSKNNGKDCYSVYNRQMAAHGFEYNLKEPLASPKRFINNYFENDIIFNIFEMLYETNNVVITINKILEIVGQKFSVDRVYIFEVSEDGQRTSNIFEWCAQGIAPEIQSLQDLSVDDLNMFFSMYNEEGIACCNDINILGGFSRETLVRQGIKAFLHCGFYENGKMRGFIGFDDCTDKRVWHGDEIATLCYITRILSIFIMKSHISRELTQSYQTYIDMLDELNGFVYVVNKDFDMLYMNKAMTNLGGVMGSKCYEFAFGATAPCADCPVKHLNANVQKFAKNIQSQKLGCVVNAAASRLTWTNGEKAAVVCCTPLSEDEDKS